jgi:hypothetical protein
MRIPCGLPSARYLVHPGTALTGERGWYSSQPDQRMPVLCLLGGAVVGAVLVQRVSMVATLCVVITFFGVVAVIASRELSRR